LFGALGKRLRAWTGGGGEQPDLAASPPAPEATTAERLDGALARLRDRVPAEDEPADSGDDRHRK
jgi:hypothetical protein